MLYFLTLDTRTFEVELPQLNSSYRQDFRAINTVSDT